MCARRSCRFSCDRPPGAQPSLLFAAASCHLSPSFLPPLLPPHAPPRLYRSAPAAAAAVSTPPEAHPSLCFAAVSNRLLTTRRRRHSSPAGHCLHGCIVVAWCWPSPQAPATSPRLPELPSALFCFTPLHCQSTSYVLAFCTAMAHFSASVQPLVKAVKYSLRQLDVASGNECSFVCCARLASGRLALLHATGFPKSGGVIEKDMARRMKQLFASLSPDRLDEPPPSPSITSPSIDVGTQSLPVPLPPPANATESSLQSSSTSNGAPPLL